LRFHSAALYPRSNLYLPAMVAALCRSDNKKVIAVQLTYLNERTGEKASVAEPRMTFGRMGSGAVWLAQAGETLGLAEGIETALAAMQIFGIPCWAVLGSQRLSRITVPDTVKEMHLFADSDDAGKGAAERAVHQYTHQGKHVVLHQLPEGRKDWNDVVLARRGIA
jgi:hypothetical protein